MTLKKLLKQNPNLEITKTASGSQGELHPLLFYRVDLIKNTCIGQYQKRLKKSK